MTYDLRRLRAHGLIARIPHTRRYQITGTGLQHALLFTHAHDHLPLPRGPHAAHPVHHTFTQAHGEIGKVAVFSRLGFLPALGG